MASHVENAISSSDVIMTKFHWHHAGVPQAYLESRFVMLSNHDADYLNSFKKIIHHFLETGEVNETEAQCIQDLNDRKKFDYPKTGNLGLTVLSGHSDLGDPASLSYYSLRRDVQEKKAN